MISVFLKMAMAVGLMCLSSVGLWLIEYRTEFEKKHPILFRLLTAVVFGCAAIFSTHFGIRYDDYMINVRDLGPLSAGLLFDPWDGIIAGLIGGVERYIAGTYYGVGSYTCVACSLATILAGILAAFLRKFVFDNKKPSPFFAFFIGAVVEIFHMLAVLITHSDDIVYAFDVVKTVTLPMLLGCSVGIIVETMIISRLSGSSTPSVHRRSREDTPITNTFQFWLLLAVVIGFILTFSFSYVSQTQVTIKNAETLMNLNADDIKEEIDKNAQDLAGSIDLMKEKALLAANVVAAEIPEVLPDSYFSVNYLQSLADSFGIYEINVVNENAIIVGSTIADYVGFDMTSGEQSDYFTVLLDGETKEIVQDFQPIAYDSGVSIMYAGAAVKNGYVQIGYDSSDFAKTQALADIANIVADRRVATSGTALILDESGTVISGQAETQGKTLAELGIDELWESGTFETHVVNDVESYCLKVDDDPYTILLMFPNTELFQERDILALETAFTEILLFATIFIVIYQLVKTIVVDNLHRINRSLARITDGNLNEVVDVRSNAEFASLSNDINTTVDALKRYIAEAEARIDKELEMAREIQFSALPNSCPHFPGMENLNLFASMDPAKEVGGDFYDYFFIDDKHLALVIADVSGKGIPASLFMMRGKSVLKSLAERYPDMPEKVMEEANNTLCEGNDADMFITAWIGILNIDTGKMVCANAGHEYPVFRKAGGEYELIRDKHGLVLAGMAGVPYKQYTLTLQHGDTIFVYTDGVPEATNAENELYGTDRLLTALNALHDASPAEAITAVQDDISEFVKDAPQFDDTTMLCLRL